jgi:hypothetical protein
VSDRYSSSCPCLVKLVAKNVTAIIHPNGHLTSYEGMEPHLRNKLHPLPYDTIVFCRSPTCERVFSAERAK